MRPHPLALLIVASTAAFAAATDVPSPSARATFAGGCFWCIERDFEGVPGVLSVVSGYTGGTTTNPTYEEVSGGGTGHAEAIEVTFDPRRVSYETLLRHFWRNVDPITPDAQFCDHGSQYRSAIFVHDASQQALAKASKEQLAARFDRSIVTEIVEARPFHRAEEYHQDYARKNPLRYRFYRTTCGRDRRLRELWGDEAGGATSH